MLIYGGTLILCSPSRIFASFACECRTFENFINTHKSLACECRAFFYVLPEAEKLNDLNDQ